MRASDVDFITIANLSSWGVIKYGEMLNMIFFCIIHERNPFIRIIFLGLFAFCLKVLVASFCCCSCCITAKRSWVQFLAEVAFLRGVCMFSPCLGGFSFVCSSLSIKNIYS